MSKSIQETKGMVVRIQVELNARGQQCHRLICDEHGRLSLWRFREDAWRELRKHASRHHPDALRESPNPVADFLESKGESFDQMEQEMEAYRRNAVNQGNGGHS